MGGRGRISSRVVFPLIGSPPSPQGTITAYFNQAQTGAACGAGAGTLEGVHSNTLVGVTLSVHLNLATATATLTLTGPAGAWFGVGFNASAMKEAPWAIVVDGTGKVSFLHKMFEK